MTSPGIFPFGRAVVPRRGSALGKRSVFILGAYPSALHVSWSPPAPFRPIRAIAVDNEPEPFWNGKDQDARIAAWKRDVGFSPERHGVIAPAGRLNGSSGEWVDENVLAVLGRSRAEAWISDALDTYRCSENLAARIADTYVPYAAANELPAAALLPHPTEAEIVRESLNGHDSRLRAEFETASPDQIVTLGNAALAVVREILPRCGGADTMKLSASDAYGAPVRVRLGARDVELIPLAHPAAPPTYQAAHARWCEARATTS